MVTNSLNDFQVVTYLKIAVYINLQEIQKVRHGKVNKSYFKRGIFFIFNHYLTTSMMLTILIFTIISIYKL